MDGILEKGLRNIVENVIGGLDTTIIDEDFDEAVIGLSLWDCLCYLIQRGREWEFYQTYYEDVNLVMDKELLGDQLNILDALILYDDYQNIKDWDQYTPQDRRIEYHKIIEGMLNDLAREEKLTPYTENETTMYDEGMGKSKVSGTIYKTNHSTRKKSYNLKNISNIPKSGYKKTESDFLKLVERRMVTVDIAESIYYEEYRELHREELAEEIVTEIKQEYIKLLEDRIKFVEMREMECRRNGSSENAYYRKMECGGLEDARGLFWAAINDYPTKRKYRTVVIGPDFEYEMGKIVQECKHCDYTSTEMKKELEKCPDCGKSFENEATLIFGGLMIQKRKKKNRFHIVDDDNNSIAVFYEADIYDAIGFFIKNSGIVLKHWDVK